MKVYPLKSMSLEEATQKQFDCVDAITHEFEGSSILSLGDLGVHPNGNIPQTTRKVEKVIRRIFNSEDSILVRGAGTGAIKEALASVLKHGDTLLVHTAPIYSTSITTIEQLGLKTVKANFNDLDDIKKVLGDYPNINGALIQYTRQDLEDNYSMEEVIKTIKEMKDIPIVTDDNYAVMKTHKTGYELGADLSCFSSFKLLGPEGIGIVIGKKEYTDIIRKFHYSGGSQTQGYEALEVIRGLVFAPVTHALQAIESEKIVKEINKGNFVEIEKAVIVNAQSKVILVKFKEAIAKEVLKKAEKLGAAPYPVGAESKYELVPMFYRLSGTMRKKDQEYEDYWIRINPMRSGSQTVLRILNEAVKR